MYKPFYLLSTCFSFLIFTITVFHMVVTILKFLSQCASLAKPKTFLSPISPKCQNYCWIVFSCRMVCPATLKICHEKGLHFTCKMIYLDCCSFSNQGYTKLDILVYLHVIFHLPSCTCHPFFKFSLHPSHKKNTYWLVAWQSSSATRMPRNEGD